LVFDNIALDSERKDKNYIILKGKAFVRSSRIYLKSCRKDLH
jgi:hypothetical protein